jgi:anaerobic ribonucleoside-triphosphate reductase activating protein
MADAKAQTIKIAGIVSASKADGPGTRLVVNLQGCPHGCEGCNAPNTHSFDGGTETTIKSISDMLLKNPMLTGVTFSGGEPLCQAKELIPLAEYIKECGLELAIYTGYTFEYLLDENDPNKIVLLNLADTLIDGKFEKDEKSLMLKFKGSRNKRIIDLKESFAQQRIIIDNSDRWNRLGF